MKSFGAARFFGATWLWWIVLLTGASLGAFVTCAVRVAAGQGPKGPWAELITAFLAAAAFVLALASYRFTWVKSRNDLFATMHDKLLAQDVQEARKTLVDATYEEVRALFEPSNHGQFKPVNHTLALYETFSMYAERGYVDRALYRDMWGVVLYKLRRQIRWFMDIREKRDGFKSWPHLRRFLDDLDKRPPT